MPKIPKISIAIPTHNMKNKEFFLNRALDSIRKQKFQDYEIVITEDGKMAENTNSAMKKCTGEIIKVLYMDDWLYHDNVLQEIVDKMKSPWLIMGADTNPNPIWTDDISLGNNRLGSPSALAIKREHLTLFDERMSWLLDCDLYHRLYKAFGPPDIITGVHIGIGVGDHQMTNILTDEEKLQEHLIIRKKYV